jgi:hypothetical protein
MSKSVKELEKEYASNPFLGVCYVLSGIFHPDNFVLYGGAVRDFVSNVPFEQIQDFDVFVTQSDVCGIKHLVWCGFLEKEEVSDDSSDTNGEIYYLKFLDHRVKIDVTYNELDKFDFTCNSMKMTFSMSAGTIVPKLEFSSMDVFKHIAARQLVMADDKIIPFSILVALDLNERRHWFKLLSRAIKMVKRGWSADWLTLFEINNSGPIEVCPILMDKSNFTMRLECGHAFDSESILEHLSNPNPRCPLCRQPPSDTISDISDIESV